MKILNSMKNLRYLYVRQKLHTLHVNTVKCCIYKHFIAYNRSFSSSNMPVACDKTTTTHHPKTENDYAHAVMERLNNYKGYLAILNHTDSSDPKFNSSTNLRKNVKNVNDSQLEQTFVHLYHSKRGLNQLTEEDKLIISAVDEECVSRLELWDFRISLRMADYFYNLNLSRLTPYNSKMISHLLGHLHTLTTNEFIQLLFYINVQRTCESKLMPLVECKLVSCLSQLNSEEISIAALAFFKTQYSIRSINLFKLMKLRFISDLDILPDPAVSAFAKLFRSTRIITSMQLIEILDNSLAHIAKWRPSACLHVGLITLAKHIEHLEYVKSMTRKVVNHLPELTLKELRNLLICVSTYDYIFDFAPDFYALIVERLRKSDIQAQLTDHPLNLPLCLLNLAYHACFPRDLIEQALDPNYFTLVQDKTNYGFRREYLMLDSTVEIELANYSGPRLHAKAKEKIRKLDAGRIPSATTPNLSGYEKILLNVKYQLAHLLGGYNYANIVHVLPHFKLPDILIQFDDKCNPVPVKYATSSSFHHLTAEKNIKSVCFSLVGRSSYSENTRKCMSHVKMKHRQLEILGHHVAQISWYEYVGLNEKERRTYIVNKLSSVTK